METSSTRIPPSRADSTGSGTCTSGSTVRRGGETRPTSGFAGTTSTESDGMRKLIAGMKISLDGKMEGPEGMADWVPAWSEDYGVMPQIDACLLGAGMYPGYEQYWTAIQQEPDKPHWITGQLPTPAELEWARFVAKTPHYVLSRNLTKANWPQTSFVRSLEEIEALKRQPGKDI